MPAALNLSPSDLSTTPMGRALLAGKLAATVEGSTGHVSLKFMCKAKNERSKWVTVPFSEASHVFVSVPAADGGWADKVGTYYPSGKYAGTFYSDRTADETRISAALYALRAAAAMNEDTHILQGTWCLRCGKELTTPESITCGFGPDCADEIGAYHKGNGTHAEEAQGRGRHGRRAAQRLQTESYGRGRLSPNYRLRGLRAGAGLTQDELARRADVGRATISRLENGREQPQRRTARRIAAVLRQSPADLFPDADSGSATTMPSGVELLPGQQHGYPGGGQRCPACVSLDEAVAEGAEIERKRAQEIADSAGALTFLPHDAVASEVL